MFRQSARTFFELPKRILKFPELLMKRRFQTDRRIPREHRRNFPEELTGHRIVRYSREQYADTEQIAYLALEEVLGKADFTESTGLSYSRTLRFTSWVQRFFDPVLDRIHSLMTFVLDNTFGIRGTYSKERRRKRMERELEFANRGAVYWEMQSPEGETEIAVRLLDGRNGEIEIEREFPGINLPERHDPTIPVFEMGRMAKRREVSHKGEFAQSAEAFEFFLQEAGVYLAQFASRSPEIVEKGVIYASVSPAFARGLKMRMDKLQDSIPPEARWRQVNGVEETQALMRKQQERALELGEPPPYTEEELREEICVIRCPIAGFALIHLLERLRLGAQMATLKSLQER